MYTKRGAVEILIFWTLLKISVRRLFRKMITNIHDI